ncbi:MAG TPA: hypothetical protein VF792_02270 [Ktedonobacterales bacterium]
MVRADNKQDSDRPHFYSQYWIDVAMGKPTAAAVTAPVEEEIEDEDDFAFAAPQAEVKPDTRSKASKVTEKKADTGHSTLTSLADLANIDMLMKNSAEMDDTMMPDITAGLGAAATPSVGDLDYDTSDEEATASADEEFAYEDEDEEDEDWGNSRRKKPGKSKRREPHRDF